MSTLRSSLRIAAAASILSTALHAQDPHAGHNMSMMRARDPLGVSMDRMGSGTTWIPDAVRLPAWHRSAGAWDLMLHGFVFAQYNRQSGPRGDEQLGSLNWGMFMASRSAGGGRLQLRTMLSLDPATVTAKGYPLLLQTGETYNGVPIVDRQHPHDFVMELGALYEREVTSSFGVQLYVAPSGEPALSPVAFMHRPSAMDDPVAPLSHHWQDATHISFGVVTLGAFGHSWELEASAFNGREPDERRWDIDRIRLDSYSARLTVNPTDHWSASVGTGWLKSPEALAPEESVRRMTAAVMRGVALSGGGQWSTTFAWGMNAHDTDDHDVGDSGGDEHGDVGSGSSASHAFLIESEAVLDRRNTVFGRVELVRRSEGGEGTHRVVPVSLGYIREVRAMRRATLGAGLRGTLNFIPKSMAAAYGSRTPTGVLVFVRVRPS